MAESDAPFVIKNWFLLMAQDMQVQFNRMPLILNSVMSMRRMVSLSPHQWWGWSSWPALAGSWWWRWRRGCRWWGGSRASGGRWRRAPGPAGTRRGLKRGKSVGDKNDLKRSAWKGLQSIEMENWPWLFDGNDKRIRWSRRQREKGWMIICIRRR